MPILLRDYETRSTLNLSKGGAWRYATHPDTDVLCCAYCVDDGPVKLWVPGDPVPPEFIEASDNPDWIVSAFNDNFERQIEARIMGPRYGWPVVPIERHRCLQACGLSLALSASLEKVAGALGLEQQKDNAGKLNMMALSRPRKPRKGEPAGVYWHNDPARLERLYQYCKQDVETERALQKRIGFLSSAEQAVWELDAAINDRGIFIDDALALGAAKASDYSLTSLPLKFRTSQQILVTIHPILKTSVTHLMILATAPIVLWTILRCVTKTVIQSAMAKITPAALSAPLTSIGMKTAILSCAPPAGSMRRARKSFRNSIGMAASGCGEGRRGRRFCIACRN
jgi:hypothetical protein